MWLYLLYFFLQIIGQSIPLSIGKIDQRFLPDNQASDLDALRRNDDYGDVRRAVELGERKLCNNPYECEFSADERGETELSNVGNRLLEFGGSIESSNVFKSSFLSTSGKSRIPNRRKMKNNAIDSKLIIRSDKLDQNSEHLGINISNTILSSNEKLIDHNGTNANVESSKLSKLIAKSNAHKQDSIRQRRSPQSFSIPSLSFFDFLSTPKTPGSKSDFPIELPKIELPFKLPFGRRKRESSNLPLPISTVYNRFLKGYSGIHGSSAFPLDNKWEVKNSGNGKSSNQCPRDMITLLRKLIMNYLRNNFHPKKIETALELLSTEIFDENNMECFSNAIGPSIYRNYSKKGLIDNIFMGAHPKYTFEESSTFSDDDPNHVSNFHDNRGADESSITLIPLHVELELEQQEGPNHQTSEHSKQLEEQISRESPILADQDLELMKISSSLEPVSKHEIMSILLESINYLIIEDEDKISSPGVERAVDMESHMENKYLDFPKLLQNIPDQNIKDEKSLAVESSGDGKSYQILPPSSIASHNSENQYSKKGLISTVQHHFNRKFPDVDERDESYGRNGDDAENEVTHDKQIVLLQIYDGNDQKYGVHSLEASRIEDFGNSIEDIQETDDDLLDDSTDTSFIHDSSLKEQDEMDSINEVEMTHAGSWRGIERKTRQVKAASRRIIYYQIPQMRRMKYRKQENGRLEELDENQGNDGEKDDDAETETSTHNPRSSTTEVITSTSSTTSTSEPTTETSSTTEDEFSSYDDEEDEECNKDILDIIFTTIKCFFNMISAAIIGMEFGASCCHQ